MRIPDFFIVGAPKCGTSSLYAYLRDHPAVFRPRLEEPHHFCEDLPGQVRLDRRRYVELFEEAPQGSLVGEKSPSYLFSTVAIGKIIDENPKAKMIAILRNPIDAAYSYHAMEVWKVKEDVEDFGQAWRLQDKRRKGYHIPKYCTEPRLLQYRELFSFSTQIARLFALVPEAQRVVLILEDIAGDPRQAYLSLLRFLDLPDDGRSEFPRVNASKVLRNRSLAEWHRRARDTFGGCYQWFMPAVHAMGIYPARVVRRWNVRERKRPPLGEDFRRELAREFTTDVRELEKLLGRPLTCWSDFA